MSTPPPTLSTGQPSTLGVWRDLCAGILGADSPATEYFDRKIEEQGRDEPVLADETQVMALIGMAVIGSLV